MEERGRQLDNGKRQETHQAGRVCPFAEDHHGSVINGFRATCLINLNPDSINFNKVLKKAPITPFQTETASRRLKEVRSHLSYLESKIGLDRVHLLFAAELNPSDEDEPLEDRQRRGCRVIK